jgi:hypothetical protein
MQVNITLRRVHSNIVALEKEYVLYGMIKKSVHLMITIQKVTSNVQSVPRQSPDCLASDRQGQGDTRLTLTPSVIPNSNYVIMVSD